MITELIENAREKKVGEIFKKYIPKDDVDIKKFLDTSKSIKNLGKAGKKGAIYFLTLKDGNRIISILPDKWVKRKKKEKPDPYAHLTDF